MNFFLVELTFLLNRFEVVLLSDLSKFNILTTDIPIDKIKECVGDVGADVENEVLKNEQNLQV